MNNEILGVIADYLDVDVSAVHPEATLEGLGIDSVDFLEILFEIEEKLGMRFKGEYKSFQNELHSIGDVIRLVEQHGQNSLTSPSVEHE